MDLRKELILSEIGKMVIDYYGNNQIDYEKIANNKSVQILEEIKSVIHNKNLNDFEIVDEILNIFIRYNIDIGSCHDF